MSPLWISSEKLVLVGCAEEHTEPLLPPIILTENLSYDSGSESCQFPTILRKV
jgi:hypothetical protein